MVAYYETESAMVSYVFDIYLSTFFIVFQYTKAVSCKRTLVRRFAAFCICFELQML